MPYFLVCCDHYRRIVSADDAIAAKVFFECKTCPDIRAYLATEEDKRVVGGGLHAVKKSRHKSTDQQDWVSR